MIRRPVGQFWCPLIFLVAGMMAIFVLGSQNNALPLAIVLGALFVAPYVIFVRIPDSGAAIWAGRAIIYFLIYIATRGSDSSVGDPADPHFIFVLGECAAAEMVMQCWRTIPTGNPPGSALILFAGLAFTGATYVSDDTLIPWLTPAFFVFLILSWRRIEAQTIKDPMTMWAAGVYVVGILLAVGAGGLTYWTVTGNRDKLNRMFLNVAPITGEAGMSSQPQLGPIFGLQGSPERVLILSVDPCEPHLRAMAFHTYFGGTWGPAATDRPYIPMPSTIGAPKVGQELVHVRKVLYASGLVYAPLDSGYIKLFDAGNSNWSPRQGGPIRWVTPAPSEYSFSLPEVGADLYDTPVERQSLAEDLQVPEEISPKVIKLCHELVEGKIRDDDKVNAICGRLDRDHKYSLTYLPERGDPVSMFILSKKAAHCEYFASAAVIMLRCVGIPARYVIGYYAHERSKNGEVVVRQRDAHAWAEAFYDGHWQTVDATPSDGRPDELFGPVPWWQTWMEWIQDQISFLQDYVQTLGPSRVIAVTAGVLGFYFFVRLIFIELRKRTTKTKVKVYQASQKSEAAVRFERLLKSRSIDVPDGRTWKELLDEIDPLPFDRDTAMKFVDDYNQQRFGGIDGKELEAVLTELERSPQADKKG